MASSISANMFIVAVFDGKSDFNVWKQKMRLSVFKVIDLSFDVTETKHAEMNGFAYSTIMLNLSDAFRKVE